MSLTQFAVLLELYDEDYEDTMEYTQLFTDFPPGLTPSLVFHDLYGSYQYVPGQSKSSQLT